jgi:hypothetical protein
MDLARKQKGRRVVAGRWGMGDKDGKSFLHVHHLQNFDQLCMAAC